jgi:hypothetical protein
MRYACVLSTNFRFQYTCAINSELKPRWVKSCKGGEPHGLPKWCWNLHYFSLKFLDHLQKGPKEVDWVTRTVLQRTNYCIPAEERTRSPWWKKEEEEDGWVQTTRKTFLVGSWLKTWPFFISVARGRILKIENLPWRGGVVTDWVINTS